jgi:hypothetical protein
MQLNITKQNIKLTIMFIVGLPGLPLTCFVLLFSKITMPQEQWDKEMFIAQMLLYATMLYLAMWLGWIFKMLYV